MGLCQRAIGNGTEVERPVDVLQAPFKYASKSLDAALLLDPIRGDE